MKTYGLLLALLVTGNLCHAQLLKKLGNKAKEEVEWRAQRKAGQKIDQGLDSLLAVPAKVVKKKGADKETTSSKQQKESGNAGSKQGSANSSRKAEPEKAELGTKDGHITLKLSASKIFTGGSIAYKRGKCEVQELIPRCK
jgi:hypothetical protein